MPTVVTAPKIQSFLLISDLQKGRVLTVLTAKGERDEIEILDPNTGDAYLKRGTTPKRRGSLLGSVPSNGDPKKRMPDSIILGWRLIFSDLVEQKITALPVIKTVWLDGEQILSAD